MRRRLIPIALALLAVVYLCGPAFEAVDHWDQFPRSGNDLVLASVSVLLCLGATLAVTLAVGKLFCQMERALTCCLVCPSIAATWSREGYSRSHNPQPLALRI
jgi:hypothetical protein